MNLDTHYLILYGIAGVAVLVWLCGLAFLLNVKRTTVANVADFGDDDPDLTPEPGQVSVRGFSEVVGQPAELSAKAASYLAQQGVARLGPVNILDQNESRVLFEGLPHLGGRFIGRGVLEFHPVDGGRTRIDYTVMAPQRNGLLLTAWVIQVMGLIALVVGFVVLHTWVAPHPNSSVRWQSIQMMQVSHFLWPPFLFGFLYRRVQNHVRATLDSVVHNLPYLQG